MQVHPNSIFTFGSGSSIIVNGLTKVTNNATFIIPSNGQFISNPGSQFQMGDNALIITEGQFHAIGNAESPIVFQGINGTTWEGIRAKSGNSSGVLADIQLEHTTFSNATKPIHLETPVTAYIANTTLEWPQIGVEIQPNYQLFVEPPPPPTMQISSVTMNSVFTFGITVENFSDLTINSCVMNDNDGVAGIALTNSSPKVLGTFISGFDIGVWGVANSAPLLFDQGIGGYNVLTSNLTAAQFEGNSNAALGIDDGTGGQNSFTGYQTYAVRLEQNSIVNAEGNWWDTPDPTENLFEILGDSKLYWEPYLREPPGGNSLLTSGGKKDDDGSDPRLTLADPRMKQVLHLRVQNRNVEAAALLRSIVDNQSSTQIKRWSLGHLLAVSQKLRSPNLSTYLNSLQSTHPNLRQYLDELTPGAFIHERSVRSALDGYTNNLRNHSNSITEAQALYGNFTYALYGEGNRTEAQALLNTLQSRYPLRGQTKLATAQLTSTLQSTSPGHELLTKGGVSNLYNPSPGATPTTFSLEQNYPNPFNPTTNIRFAITDYGLVALKVFDVLGREVAALVNRELNAGHHEAVFDASRLASGIYMYKLQSGSQISVKRMLLLK